MIVCNSNNFAVTRAQKTGGASLEIYFLESGLIDYDNDVYTLEGGFSTWQEFKEYSDAHDNLKYSELPRELYGYDYLKDAQKTYTEVVKEGLATADMPWVGTIRNPLDWLSSLYYYANVRRKLNAAENLKKKLLEETLKLNVGPYTDEKSDFGPLNNKAHYEKVLGYIDTGEKEGAKLLADGRNMKLQGCLLYTSDAADE